MARLKLACLQLRSVFLEDTSQPRELTHKHIFLVFRIRTSNSLLTSSPSGAHSKSVCQIIGDLVDYMKRVREDGACEREPLAPLQLNLVTPSPSSPSPSPSLSPSLPASAAPSLDAFQSAPFRTLNPDSSASPLSEVCSLEVLKV